MLTLNDMVKLKGRKVHLTTCDGKYEGIVKYISPGTQEVTLANVLILPSQAPLYGVQHFYIFDITSCEVVSASSTLPTDDPCYKDLKKKTKNAVASEAKNESFLKSAKSMTFYVDEVEFGETISDIEDGNDNDQSLISKEAEYKLSLPKEYEEILPKDFLLIGDIGVDFRDAIYHLKKQSMIGVAFEGNSIGRHGTLCWIGVSTKWCTFLFDISTLEEKAFVNGLKAVLEDCDILKVIHDCRQASDLLYHQYGTTLVNIFDTQIADIFINLQNSKSGKAQSRVKSLTSCLTHYLNLCDEDLYPYEMTHHSSKENFLWTNRPASNLMKDSIIKDVLFLRELRSIQMDLMLSSYINAVDIYLGVLRDASEEELELMPSQPSLLPQALMMNGLKVIDCKSCTGNIPSTEERFIQMSKSSGFISAVQKNKEDATKMKLAKKQPLKEFYIKGKQFHQEIKAVDDSKKKISQNQKQYTCPLQKSFSPMYTSKCSAQSLMKSEQPSFPECDSEHLKKLRYRNMQYSPPESHRHSSSHFTTHCQSQFSNKQNCFSSQKSCLPENVYHYSSDGLCSSSSKAITNPIECEHLKKGWSTTIMNDVPDKHIVSNSHATENEGILQGPSEYQVIEKNLKKNHVDSSVLVQNFRVEEKCVPCNSQETDDHERRCSSTTSFCSDVSENISNYDYLKIRLLPAGMLF